MSANGTSLTAVQTQQLLLAKFLLVHSSMVLDGLSPVSAGLCVSLCHDAAELVIWTIAKDVDADATDRTAFDQMWDVISKAPRSSGRALPDRARMRDVNKARVNFKHYGQLPTHPDAVRFLGYTEHFVESAVRTFYDLDFQTLSAAVHVEDATVRELIQRSEELCANGEFEECIKRCAQAEHLSLAALNQVMPKLALIRCHLKAMRSKSPFNSTSSVRYCVAKSSV